MKNTLARRQAILEVLSDRRKETAARLASEFNVSNATIRRDIEALSCSAPIFTLQGASGGILVDDG